MNKKLLVIAVGAAMVAGSTAVMAEATVYGKINMAVASYDDGDDSPNDDAGLGIFDEASRLGVKGSADIGGDLKAVFKAEGTIDMDGTNTFQFNRDSYIGVKGGFGELTIGHRNTSYKDATGKMDLFADMVGDVTGSGFGSFDSRVTNQVKYKGKFGMVSVGVDVDFSENDDNAGADRDKMGNTIAVGFAPMKGLKVTLASATRGGATTAVNDTAQKVGVQWKGGPHKVNFVYKTETDDSAATDDKSTVMYGQYGLTMGMDVIQLSYSMADTDVDDTDATQTSVAYVRNFNKKTKAYVAYTTVANGDAVSHDGRLDSGISHLDNIDAGSTATLFGVGITHKF